MIESVTTPPAGYVDIGTALVHVSQVRKFTSDIHRFMAYVPIAVKFEHVEPQSQAAGHLIASVPDVSLLSLTMMELAHLNIELADQLGALP
jgi:hypothetical protein